MNIPPEEIQRLKDILFIKSKDPNKDDSEEKKKIKKMIIVIIILLVKMVIN